MGYWKILIPETSTNMVLNPVALGTGNTTDVATGAVTIITTYSYFGYKCFQLRNLADNDGGYWTLGALANAIHYVTLRVHNTSDITPMFDLSLDNANFHTPTLLATEGTWYVYGAQIPAAQANASTKLYVLQNGAGSSNLVIGHLQVEQKTYATTPVTGDRRGFTPNGYVWNGLANAATSTRSSQERSGGLEVDLDTSYNFVVQFGTGKGMPPITHHTQPMALLPGSLYTGHKVEPRILDLKSTTVESTIPTIAHSRKLFIEAIKPDATAYEQPVVFRYYGNPIKPVEFHAVYDSGMESQETSGRGEQVFARFICYDPFCYETHDTSQVLERYLTVADADYCMRRINGVWYNISTDFNATVMSFTKGIDQSIYIGGLFTNVGAATGDYIVKWNPFTSTISSLTDVTTGLSGANDAVRSLITAPNGDIYLAGAFTLAGNVANTKCIARWNGSNFLPLLTGIAGVGAWVNCMVFGIDGIIYVGGNFINVFDASGDFITRWDGAAFSSMGTGMDGIVYTVAVAPNGDIYAGGAFHLAGGVANTVHIAKWGGDTDGWLPLGTGTDDEVDAIAIDKAGNVYIGGAFHNANGVACNHIAKWNGQTFEPLGAGLDGPCYSLAIDNNGLLHIGGTFTTAGGLYLADRYAIWNGTTYYQPDIDLPGNPGVYAILPIHFADDNPNINSLYIGYDTAGTATTTRTTTIDIPTTNPGSKYVYPMLVIHRADDGTSATLNSLENVSTGKKIMFNYALQKGETLTLNLTPGNRSIKSDFYGDVWRAVLRGSDFASWGLIGGTNVVSLFVVEVGAPTVTAWLEWTATHWSSDTAAA